MADAANIRIKPNGLETAALIGLGAIGLPLAHALYRQLGDSFYVLADRAHADRLTEGPLDVNGARFAPIVAVKRTEISSPVSALFVCVKNYSLEETLPVLREFISDETVILPLQNGIYAKTFFEAHFPDHVVLEGFAQGPNTVRSGRCYTYSEAGTYHVGTSDLRWKEHAARVHDLLCKAGVRCYLDDDIRHTVWKKFMLNVAGNALTALTHIDYNMFAASETAQSVSRTVMEEFRTVAEREGIAISQQDIDDTIAYFVNYPASKHTSMLEDVLHRRRTENDYIAGQVLRLAKKHGVAVPATKMLYDLMKIREDVYLGRLS